jgi:tetratricopeptide (TPR) repeat protein
MRKKQRWTTGSFMAVISLTGVPQIGVYAQTADSAYYGHSPAEARAVIVRLARYERQITQLSKSNAIQRATLLSIARAMGLRNPGLDDDMFLSALRRQAQDASALRGRILELTTEVSALADVALRTPANSSLQRAKAAFDSGDLQAAESELASLKSLRASDNANANAAWLDAVQAQAEVARLRGNLERMDALLADADKEIEQNATLKRWKLALQGAQAWRVKGDQFADKQALRIAMNRLLNSVIQLVPRNEYRLEWAETQRYLGATYQSLWSSGEGSNYYELALSAFQDANSTYSPEIDSVEWADIQNEIASLTGISVINKNDSIQMDSVVDNFKSALSVASRNNDKLLIGKIQTNIGVSLTYQGVWTGDTRKIEFSIQYLRDALPNLSSREAALTRAVTYNGLGDALLELYARSGKSMHMIDGIASYREASRIYSAEGWIRHSDGSLNIMIKQICVMIEGGDARLVKYINENMSNFSDFERGKFENCMNNLQSYSRKENSP